MTTANESPPPEISLVEAVWRYRWSSLFIVVLCGLLAVGATEVLFKDVQATAKFAVTDPQTTDLLHQGVSSGQNYSTYTAQRAAFAQSAAVLERAAQLASKGSSPMSLQSMRSSVSTTASTDGGIVAVTAKASDMPKAARIANAVVQAYQDLTDTDVKNRKAQLLKDIQDQETHVSAQLAAAKPGSKAAGGLTTQLNNLRNKENELIADITDYGSGVQFVDQADPSQVAHSKLPTNGGIGLAIGVLIACVVAFLRATTPGGRRAAQAGARGGRGGGRRADRRPPPRETAGVRFSPEAVARASQPYPPHPYPSQPHSPQSGPSAQRTAEPQQAAPPAFGQDIPNRPNGQNGVDDLDGRGNPVTTTRPEPVPERPLDQAARDSGAEGTDKTKPSPGDGTVPPETQKYVSSLMRYNTDQES